MSQFHPPNSILKDDKSEFKLFFEEVFPVMVIFASRFVKSKDIAEDICQEAFVVVWEKWSGIKNGEDARFYLYSIVRNKCLNHLKSQKLRLAHQATIQQINEDCFENNLLEHEVFLMFRIAISKLAPQSQKIINLSLKGYGNNEISKELYISVNTIKTLKQRAYKTLNKKLKEHFYMFFL